MKKILVIVAAIVVLFGTVAAAEMVEKGGPHTIMPIGPSWDDPVYLSNCPPCQECPAPVGPFFAPTLLGDGTIVIPMVWNKTRLIRGPWRLIMQDNAWRLESSK